VPGVPKAVRVAVVGVTDRALNKSSLCYRNRCIKQRLITRRILFRILVITLSTLGVLVPLLAAVLPEDRADVLYHSYDGGGIEVTGPSILWRKMIGKYNSVMANYYIDAISSASIDVITSASPYSEHRTEKSVGLTSINEATTMNLAYTTSSENDYDAQSAHIGFSHDLFGDLTTVSLGYSRGWDEVGKSGDPTFAEDADRQNYRLGFSQILTKNSLIGLDFETITDEGFLNNPYRSVRYLDATSALGYSYEPEVYPRTRTSNAVAIRALYYLPYRAAIRGEYRLYTDTWDINAQTFGLGYTHPLEKDWILDFRYRYYTQTHADFYSDLFPFQQSQNFLARDKELSSFNDQTIGIGISYEFSPQNPTFIDKGSLSLNYDHIRFDYDDFRDLTVVTAPGQEPAYSFSADTVQFFLSIWY